MTLSFAPFDLWPLAIISLAFLHYLLKNNTPKQAFITGAFFGAGLLLSGTHWVYVSIHEHGNAHPLLAGTMTGLFCIGIGILLAPFTAFYARFVRGMAYLNPLGFAAIFCLSEWFRLWFLTGFPWLYAGYSQLEGPLSGFAPVIGTLGISFLLAFIAASLSHIYQHRRYRLALVLVAIFALGIHLQKAEWTMPINDRAYTVALVQGNIAQADKWNPEFKAPIMQYYNNRILGLMDNDLIVLPETALPNYLHRVSTQRTLWDNALQAHNSALIFGAPSVQSDKNDQLQILNTLATAGMASGIYHKQKLVPFGEYLPLNTLLRGAIDFFNLPMSDFSKGPKNQSPFTVHNIKVMPYICYEVVYPDFVSHSASKAHVLLTVSNDSWFGTSIGPLQHFQMARMRALENGRFMLRATNNGVTAVIDPKGRIVDQLPQFTEGVLRSEVYAYQGLTPVMQYGTLPAIIFSFLTLFAGLFISLRRASISID